MNRRVITLAFLPIGCAAVALGGGDSTAAPPALTLLTVSAATDVSNGDVATVAGLVERPGPDGISLREAMEATNNDPGAHEIRFSARLAGKSIAAHELPGLTGGGVDISGDVNGDGRPDVTIRETMPCDASGFVVSSSGNRLHGLTLRDFKSGVEFAPPTGRKLPRRTIADNEVSSLVMDVCQNGIWFQAAPSTACGAHACATGNRWLDTRIVGNTIATRMSGIEVQLYGTIGERVERLTITGNRIAFRTKGDESSSGWGVHLLSGGGYGGSVRNRIADVLVSGNTFTGNPQGGVRLAAGDNGADTNTLERVRIVGNRVDARPGALRNAIGVGYIPQSGVVVIVGDACSDWVAPKVRPLRCPERNLVRDVEIARNTLRQGNGVTVVGGVAGAVRNTVRGVRVRDNTIAVRIPSSDVARDWMPGVLVMAGVGTGEPHAPTTGNRVHDLSITGNRITILPGPLPSAGILVVGGRKFGATGNSVTCVRVGGNRVTGVRTDVLLLSGSEDAAGNSVSRAGC